MPCLMSGVTWCDTLVISLPCCHVLVVPTLRAVVRPADVRLSAAGHAALQADAHLQIPQLREHHPFAVADQGFGLRGQPFNITVAWNIMPYVGEASSKPPVYGLLCRCLVLASRNERGSAALQAL